MAKRVPIPFPKGSREWRREHGLRANYKITTAEFTRLFDAQNGRCAICRAAMDLRRGGKRKVACVDHDHETDVIRGLLCGGCNVFLGKFEKYQSLLPHIQTYLFNGCVSHSRFRQYTPGSLSEHYYAGPTR